MGRRQSRPRRVLEVGLGAEVTGRPGAHPAAVARSGVKVDNVVFGQASVVSCSCVSTLLFEIQIVTGGTRDPLPADAALVADARIARRGQRPRREGDSGRVCGNGLWRRRRRGRCRAGGSLRAGGRNCGRGRAGGGGHGCGRTGGRGRTGRCGGGCAGCRGGVGRGGGGRGRRRNEFKGAFLAVGIGQTGGHVTGVTVEGIKEGNPQAGTEAEEAVPFVSADLVVTNVVEVSAFDLVPTDAAIAVDADVLWPGGRGLLREHDGEGQEKEQARQQKQQALVTARERHKLPSISRQRERRRANRTRI